MGESAVRLSHSLCMLMLILLAGCTGSPGPGTTSSPQGNGCSTSACIAAAELQKCQSTGDCYECQHNPVCSSQLPKPTAKAPQWQWTSPEGKNHDRWGDIQGWGGTYALPNVTFSIVVTGVWAPKGSLSPDGAFFFEGEILYAGGGPTVMTQLDGQNVAFGDGCNGAVSSCAQGTKMFPSSGRHELRFVAYEKGQPIASTPSIVVVSAPHGIIAPLSDLKLRLFGPDTLQVGKSATFYEATSPAVSSQETSKLRYGVVVTNGTNVTASVLVDGVTIATESELVVYTQDQRYPNSSYSTTPTFSLAIKCSIASNRAVWACYWEVLTVKVESTGAHQVVIQFEDPNGIKVTSEPVTFYGA